MPQSVKPIREVDKKYGKFVFLPPCIIDNGFVISGFDHFYLPRLRPRQ